MSTETTGRTIGRYRVLSELGRGASATVYRCEHPALQRIVAVKCLHPAHTTDPSFTSTFLAEARTLASMNHPNIVQVYDAEARPGLYYMAMELIDGQEVADHLADRGALEADETRSILRQLASALAYAHARGVAHRDVKPQNCVLAVDGRVKLMDFGLAQHESNAPTSRTAMVDGTPKYLAPEAARGEPLDGRADVYSLGVMAFQMVTGRLPFEAEDVRTLLQMHVRMAPPDVALLRPDLPEPLVRFIRGALRKRPDDRLTEWSAIQELLA